MNTHDISHALYVWIVYDSFQRIAYIPVIRRYIIWVTLKFGNE